MVKTQRTDIFVSAEDYFLWQSVESKVLGTTLQEQSDCENEVRIARLGVLVGVVAFVTLSLGTLTVFSAVMISVATAYTIKAIDPIYCNIFKGKLHQSLKIELAIMRDVLKRAGAEGVDVAEVSSSPWINARYFLRKK